MEDKNILNKYQQCEYFVYCEKDNEALCTSGRRSNFCEYVNSIAMLKPLCQYFKPMVTHDIFDSFPHKNDSIQTDK